MIKIFNKYEMFWCMLLIVLYIIINSYCLQELGIYNYKSAIINTLFSGGVILLMGLLKRTSYYGLRRVENIKCYLYFIPLFLIVSVNLWNGFNVNNSFSEIIFFVINMINVGFIEEIIFRGFLFKMMVNDNVKSAIIVSSITFGIGHIINLFMGASLIPTILQICYAMAIGYLFVIIFYKSNSLIPCIITHSLTNALSIFNVDNSRMMYITSLFLIIVPIIYARYINKKID